MNIFRFSGDMCHVAGVLLLLKMAKRGNASGISLKAQELYLIVFLTRYLDLFTTFYSIYNALLKILYIVATAAIVALLRRSDTSESTYSPTHDSFQHWKYLLLPTILAGSVTHFTFLDHGYVGPIFDWYSYRDLLELLWTISIYLESVAMVPQLIMFRSDRFVKENKGGARDEILLPVFLFGIYRVLYVVNWVYRAHVEYNYRHHYVVYFCGCLQVFFYSQFFHIFCRQQVYSCRSSEDASTVPAYVLMEDGSNGNDKDENAGLSDDELTSLLLNEEGEVQEKPHDPTKTEGSAEASPHIEKV